MHAKTQVILDPETRDVKRVQVEGLAKTLVEIHTTSDAFSSCFSDFFSFNLMFYPSVIAATIMV